MGSRERGSPGNDLRMGIPGVGEIHPGSHLCALYSGPVERDRLLVSFVREGLRHGDRCVCLVDDLGPAGMRRRAFGPAGPGDTNRSGNLGVHPASDAFLRAGKFSAEQMLSFLVPDGGPCADVGFPMLRAAGEMPWTQCEPGAAELFAYEAAVSQVLVRQPAVFLCMYDLQQVGVSTLVDALRIHSTALISGSVLHNPDCLAPIDHEQPSPAAVRYELVRRGSGGLDGGDLWLSLTGAEVRLADLVASGMTNRAMATELIVSPHTVDAHLKHIYLKLGIHSRVELTVLALRHGPRAADARAR